MNDLIADSLRLLNKILSDTFEEYPLVHIAQNEYVVFSFPSFSKLPTGYGCVVDRTPQFLEREGVIKVLYSGKYVIFGYKNRLTMGRDRLEFEASELVRCATLYEKYVGRKIDLDGYSFFTEGAVSIRGLRFIVVNGNAARSFIKKHSQILPVFDVINGVLSFSGEDLPFDGEITRKSVQLLIENVNSIVSPQDFHRLPRGEEKKSNFKTTEEEKRMFKDIRKKIESNKILKDALVCVVRRGFGIFLNQKLPPILSVPTPQTD